MTLADVTLEFQKTNISQLGAVKEQVSFVKNELTTLVKFFKDKALDELEARREAAAAARASAGARVIPRSGTSSSEGQAFGPGLLGGLLGGLAGAIGAPLLGIGAAISAILSGYETELRAALTGTIDTTLKIIRNTFGIIKSAFLAPVRLAEKLVDGIKLIKTPKFIAILGDGVLNFFRRIGNIFPKIEIPSITESVGNFFRRIGNFFSIFALQDFGKNLTTLQESISTKITKFIEPISKLITTIKESKFISSIGKIFSTLGSIGKGVGGGILAVAELGATTIKGFGSFLRGVFGFLDPVLDVLGKLFRFLRLNPLTNLIFVVFDFVTGFFEGFKGVDKDASFVDKIIGGIKGGLLGIVKGFLSIFDLVLFKLPAFILEFFGAEILAAKLKDLKLFDIITNALKIIPHLFKNIPEIAATAVDLLKLKFKLLGQKMGSGIEILIKTVSNMFANFADRILKFAAEKLRFKIPELSFTAPQSMPFFGGNKYTLLKGLDIGLNKSVAEGADNRIASRNNELSKMKDNAGSERAATLDEISRLSRMLSAAMTPPAPVIIQNDGNRTNVNNTSVSVTPISPVDGTMVGVLE